MATCFVRRASFIASTLFRPRLSNPSRLFHSSVFRSDLYKNADLDTFTKVTQAKDRLVLVDFYADWCGPCHQLSPILEKLCSDSNVKSGVTGHSLDLVKIDVDSNDGGSLAQQYKVTALPTVFAFQNGKPISQFRGAVPEHVVRKFVEEI
ncbi:thioredoxin-like protein [Amanita rubescens]|nr:thioredoxin-like protein [Amanita rubescens]